MKPNEWDGLARAYVLRNIQNIIGFMDYRFEGRIGGRYPIIAQVVDADLIKPHTVRFKVTFKISDQKGVVRAQGVVYSSQRVKSGD